MFNIVESEFFIIDLFTSSECISAIDGSTSPGGCPPPADEAGIAETGLKQAAPELQRIDKFGLDASQRERTRKYVPVDEYDSDGDLMPDGTFSSSSSESGSDDYDSEVDDPSKVCGVR